MPVDSSIPFQAFATTKLLSPTEIQQNALAMQLQKMQLQQAQDAMNDKQNVRNQNNALARALQGAILPTGGVDYGKLSAAQGIDPNRQLEFADQARQLQEQNRLRQQQSMDRVKKALLYSDTPQKWDASVDELAKDHPEIAQYKGKYSPELRMSFIAQYAPELLKRDVKSVNLGGKEMFVDTNPNTNPDIVGKTFEKTASPDAVLNDARMRSEGEKNRALTMRGQDLVQSRSEQKQAQLQNKPLPVGALKMQQESVDAINTAASISSDLGAIQKQIQTGKLKLGPMSNAMSGLQNALGMSDEGSRNYASFKNTLNKLRNDSLRLNKGTQTEGDAVRAWDELITNFNDPELVKKRLTEIQNLNKRAVQWHKTNIGNIRANYGVPDLNLEQNINQPSAISGGNDGWSAKEVK